MPKTPGRLVVIAGLPGAGKSSLARDLAQQTGGTIFSPDDWLDALGLDLWDSERRDRIEQLHWQVAQALLAAGGTAIIEWGTWARSERDQLRLGARRLGASVELHFLDAPPETLFERVSVRGRETPPLTLAQLQDYSAAIERPTAEELALYDPSPETP